MMRNYLLLFMSECFIFKVEKKAYHSDNAEKRFHEQEIG
jgi:hypothetical protein